MTPADELRQAATTLRSARSLGIEFDWEAGVELRHVPTEPLAAWLRSEVEWADEEPTWWEGEAGEHICTGALDFARSVNTATTSH